MAYFGSIFFANKGGGGGQNYLHNTPPISTAVPPPPHLYGSTFGKILGVGVTGTFLVREWNSAELKSLGWHICRINQRKTKGQQLKGKIVSYFFTSFRTFWHFLALFGTFSEFFPQDFPLQNKGF